MQKFFNTTGFCRPEQHYMVEPLRGLEKQITQLIEKEQYFVIHAPRQTGKTTLLHAFAHKLNASGKYNAIAFSLEEAGYRSITEHEANRKMILSLISSARIFLKGQTIPAYEEPETMRMYFEKLCSNSPKPIVLFIDEIDSLYDDILISVLRQLRNGFQLRPHTFPASVALVGLRDIRDYKMKIREQDGVLGSGSPFNIKAESFRLNNFSRQQIAELYAQHTTATGQIFSNELIEQIYELTGGQPWLVNALANEIVSRMLEDDYSREITAEIVETAKENLILRRDTHLDSLMDKLNEDRVKRIIQAIINGDSFVENTFNNDLLYCIDLGIVAQTRNGITISNKIYTEIIPRILNASMQASLTPQVSPQWFIKNGLLNMDALLKEFQQFYRRNSESWIDRFSYQEAGKQLLLMAFLQRVVNGGGRIDREMAYGRTRTDLTIEFGGETFILELKIKYNTYSLQDGLEQLSGYLDKAGLMSGYLLLFEQKTSKEIAWEERIKWQVTDFEWQGVSRRITVVEM